MPGLAFLHQKGGTGKTTLAIAAALALSEAGLSVLVLDLDPQGTATAWADRYPALTGGGAGVVVRPQLANRLDTAVTRLARGFDWTLVDSPPTLDASTLGVLALGLPVLIPVRPAAADLWPLDRVATIARACGATRMSVVVNQHRDEPLAPVADAAAHAGLSLYPEPLPADPGLTGLFSGEALPPRLAVQILRMVRWATGVTPPSPGEPGAQGEGTR